MDVFTYFIFLISSVIRQNCEFQNGCLKKTKHAKLAKHTYVCVSGGKKCSFFGKVGVPCFLETPVLRFTLLPYYRQFKIANMKIKVFNIVAGDKLTVQASSV